jgi:metallo-beta-lactamase family protein
MAGAEAPETGQVEAGIAPSDIRPEIVAAQPLRTAALGLVSAGLPDWLDFVGNTRVCREAGNGGLRWGDYRGSAGPGFTGGTSRVQISFHGADREVTGSCHLIECAGKRILIDCGMFQGSRDIDEVNAEPFGFEAAAIDVLLLTHAHLDHCGRLPLLLKRGFHGEIIATAATRELARLVMIDSARLQEEAAARKARRTHNGAVPEPLYTLLDAMNVLDLFGRTVVYAQPIEVAAGIRATFLDAGHILGSAGVFLELDEGGKRRRVMMSGDIGNRGRPLLNPFVPPPASDVVVMESTYGDRMHRPFAESVEEFYAAIADTFARGGNVIIPTFALERAQELLYYMHLGMADGLLPRTMQVFLDSPMAISATEIYRRHPGGLSRAAAAAFAAGEDPLTLPGLHLTPETADSMRINAIRGGAVIMAGSGMATGGRIVHHLRHNIWRRETGIVFVGFAAKGTLARTIIDGAERVRIFDEELPVKARRYTIGGFSAHADQHDLLAWHAPSGAKRTFLVHGEEPAMTALGALLPQTEVVLPQRGAVFEL